MSVQEIERRRRQSDDQAKQPKHRKKTEAEREAERTKREAERARIAQYQNPNQVLTFEQWCLLNAFSKATGKRLKASGDGPVFTQLSTNRIGVTVGNNRAWQASRAREEV